MLDHIFITVSDTERAIVFYERVLPLLGITNRHDNDGSNGPSGHPDLKGFGANGRVFFWLRSGTPSLQTVHVGFVADSEIMVKQAYAEAIAAGAAEIHSQQIIVDPMLTSELRYGDLWSMREFNHFDFELNGIIRAFFTHCG